LYDINEVKFRSYPELQTRLFETKQAILAAYLPNDLLLGIGLPIGDLRAKSPVHWTGQNLLGTVLMEIRKKLREEQDEKSIKKPRTRPSIPKKTGPISISAAKASLAPASLAPASLPPASSASLPPASSASLPPASLPSASLPPASSASLPPAPLVKKRPILTAELRAKLAAPS